ncbi:preATP grasp domain-containing protein [Nonomuraea sp. NPDC002799]
MAKIIVFNFDNISPKAIYRHLWLMGEGDIIVSPIEIDEEYLQYVCEMLGFSAETVSIVAANERLTDEYLSTASADIAAKLKVLIARSPTWEVEPCNYTTGVADLARRLDLTLDVGLRFAAQRGPDLLNRKSHFRQLAVGAGLPVADGSIAVTPEALAQAIERHLPETGTVIVKRDDGKGGKGNVTLTTAMAAPLPGTRETRHLDGDCRTVAKELWEGLTDDRNRMVVVESYHEASHSFYFEYLIDSRGCHAFLNSGSFRRRLDSNPAATQLVWVGLDLPAELPPSSAVNASHLAAQLVHLAAKIGYRGYVNIDAILTSGNNILFNEINGRWGGGLVLHAIGDRLVGREYADTHVVSGILDIEPMTFQEALGIIQNHGLHFSSERQEGVVILGYDKLLQRKLECAVVAADRPRARQIENCLREAIRKDLNR